MVDFCRLSLTCVSQLIPSCIEDDGNDHDEYYVFTPGMTITGKGRPSVEIIDDHNVDDDDYSHEYLKLVSVSNKSSTNQK